MNKGMSHSAVYTPLESLLLFQSTLAHGVDNAAFARISEQLRNNGLIQADDTYDSARLNPEPLQQLFLKLFQEELRGESAAGSGDATTSNSTPAPTSPNSKKRKLAGPPLPALPTLKDVYENIEKIPTLVDRLYKRYRDDIVRKIREDEKHFDTLQNMIQVIEKSEESRLARLATNKSGAPPPPLAPREIRSGPASGSPSPSPGPTAASSAANKRPTSTTPIVPPKLPPSNVPPPTHIPQGAPTTVRPPSTGPPPNGPASVLQPPPGVTQPPSGVLQAPVQPPKVPISPRPDANNQTRPPNAIPQPAAGANQGQLKWETPYQPQPTPTQPPRQHPTPVPPKTPVVPQQQGQPLKQQQQQWQNQPVQNIQPAQTPIVPSPSPSTQPAGKPLMAAPQNAGNMVSQLQPPIARPAPASPSPQPRPQSKSPVPHPPPHRHIQPQQAAQQPRPIAASPTPPAGATGTIVPPPPQRWPAGQQQPQQGVQHPSAAVSPAPVAQKPYSSPYAHQQPRPAIPEHMIRHAAAGTPLAPRRTSSIPIPPQTPVQFTPTSITRGVATKWTIQATPSTPGAPPASISVEPQSPAFEPLSPPPPKPATLPRPSAKIPKKQAARQSDVTETTTPAPTSGRGRGGRPSRGGGSFRGRRPSTTPSAGAGRRSQSVASQADELSMDHVEPVTEVKNEEVTPRPHEETGDTTADESVSGRGNVVTPASMRILKRKRPETPAEQEPPGPPTQVIWTRGFTKVSSSALDQISSHRDANMFATGVRERDAPNYRQIVLQPQDITSIRSAIKQGNKAAVAAASSLPGGDPGTASVWLPISEDLMPPKGIINSAQLERELVHMFCNAIMYNPDPLRGPGQSFVKRSQDEEEEAFGYQFDENGVVRNTRSMFLEVEKLLGDLRSAEKDRGTAPPLSTPRLSTAATPADDTADDEDELAGDGGEGSGTFKRRRLRG